MKKMSASNESWRIIALSFYIRSTVMGYNDDYKNNYILLFINKFDN